MINEEYRLLQEQKDNNAASKIISTHLSNKLKGNKNDIENTIKKIVNANNVQSIVDTVKSKNPNIDSEKIKKIGQKIIENKPKRDYSQLLKWFSSIVFILGITFTSITKQPYWLVLAGMISGYLGYKSGSNKMWGGTNKFFSDEDDIAMNFNDKIDQNKIKTTWQILKDIFLKN